MSISSIGAANPYLPIQQTAATQAQATPAKKDPDHDGDVDGVGPDQDAQSSTSGINILA